MTISSTRTGGRLKRWRSVPLCLAAAAIAGSAIAAERFTGPQSLVTLSGSAFGTTYSIKLAEPAPGTEPQEVVDRVRSLLSEIDSEMSLWRDDSELSQFNAHDGTGWFDVSDDTARVVSAALEVSRATNGAFDPTVAPLVELWSFGPHASGVRIPADDEIAAVRRHVGAALIEVRRSPPALRKLDPEVRIDLNAIAKGDAVDRVAELLEAFLPQGYMVEIGGEVRTRGARADDQPWRIGIEEPTIDRRLVRTAIELRDAALATSGDYRNYVEVQGRRYSHTIDPRTGRPIDHALAAVSVIAGDCMTADAWATALMVLGPEEALAAAEANEIEALLFLREGHGYSSRSTPGFPPLQQVQVPADPAGDSGTLRTFLLAAVVFVLALLGMSIGVLVSNRRLRGSCGGLSGLKDEQGNPLCDACTHPARDCEEFRRHSGQTPVKDRDADQSAK